MIAQPLLILDTHIWIWWVEQDKRLPEHVRELIEDSNQQVAVSAASVYELTLLNFILDGRPDDDAPVLRRDFDLPENL